MIYARFWKGVRLRSLKCSWRDLGRYAAWWIDANLSQLPGPPPVSVLRFLARICPHVNRRGLPVLADVFNRAWLGTGAITRVLRRPFVSLRGNNVARCDWTARPGGVLYGGSGGLTDAMFSEFINRITPTPEEFAAVAFAVSDLKEHLAGRVPAADVN